MQVAERGLKFVGALGELLTSAGLPQDFREAWAFSACLALAVQLAHTAPVSSAGMQPALMPTTSDARCGATFSLLCAGIVVSMLEALPHQPNACKTCKLGSCKALPWVVLAKSM